MLHTYLYLPYTFTRVLGIHVANLLAGQHFGIHNANLDELQEKQQSSASNAELSTPTCS